MRYLFGFICLLALVALPQSVSAQPADEDSLSSWQVDEGASLEQPAPEEPALQLKLDEAGVGVVPPLPRTADGYTLEEMELRVKRARIGLGVSLGVLFVGGVVVVIGSIQCGTRITDPTPGQPDPCDVSVWTGTALSVGGFVGTITSSALLRRRKRDRDRLQEAHYERPRRVQWDLARSRLVF
jgi:hypothetical protein